MNDFKNALNREANDMRNVIESHVKTQLGMDKPTSECGAQTLTYDRLMENIVEESARNTEYKIEQKNKLVNKIKADRF